MRKSLRASIAMACATLVLPLTMAAQCGSSSGNGGGSGNAQASKPDYFGCNANDAWLCSSSAPAPAAGGAGGVPITRADAGPAAPEFECHDSWYPRYPGFSLVKGSDGIVRLKLSVSIYCDTIAQVPTSQNTYLAMYYGHNTTTPIRQITYTELPGASIAAPTRYTLSVVCVSGDYTGKYVISSIVTQDGRTIPRYPVNGAIASSYSTNCQI